MLRRRSLTFKYSGGADMHKQQTTRELRINLLLFKLIEYNKKWQPKVLKHKMVKTLSFHPVRVH